MSKKIVIRDTKTNSLLDAYTKAKEKLIDHLQASLKLTREDAVRLVTVHGEETEEIIGHFFAFREPCEVIDCDNPQTKGE